jgi:IclR family transcriptional regulator, acetate operon repressor
VEFDAEQQLWHVGARAFVIGARFLRRTSLVDRARPILRRLMEATGETANLGMERDGQVLFLSQVETHSNIRAFFPPGTLSPLHASGIGKALLARLEPERLERLLARGPLERFTDQTITDRATLLADLVQVRVRGFALDNEEKSAGMRCIAAPVFDVNREAVAGISVSGPVSRVSPDQVARLGLQVMDAARQLTLAIGGEAAAPE